MDFNQVSARGLRRMMRNVIRRSADKEHVDVVLIGHSKTFVPYNEKTLEPFLKWVSKLDWRKPKKRCTLKKEILIFGYVKNGQ